MAELLLPFKNGQRVRVGRGYTEDGIEWFKNGDEGSVACIYPVQVFLKVRLSTCYREIGSTDVRESKPGVRHSVGDKVTFKDSMPDGAGGFLYKAGDKVTVAEIFESGAVGVIFDRWRAVGDTNPIKFATNSSMKATYWPFMIHDLAILGEQQETATTSHAHTPALASVAATATPSRMQPEHEVAVGILPTTKWEDLRPAGSMLEEMRGNPKMRGRLPDIDTIADDVELKSQDLRFDPKAKTLASVVDNDELHAIVAYTHDKMTKDKRGNFYFEENIDLRQRAPAARQEMLETWGGHVYYALRGLGKLPNFKGLVYRGNPDISCVGEYEEGRPIQWGAWTSTTTSLTAAKAFGNTGVIFKIKVLSGKDINLLSFFPGESEILLTPNHKFIVTKGVYEEDGFLFIDLQEMKGNFYVS